MMMDTDAGRMATPTGSIAFGDEAATRLRPTGDDPLRVRSAVRGAAEVAAYFGMPEREVAEDMAWYAGYHAGSQDSAAFSAGVADAEHRIMEWLRGRGLQGERLAYRISRCEHRDSDTHPKGGDASSSGADE